MMQMNHIIVVFVNNIFLKEKKTIEFGELIKINVQRCLTSITIKQKPLSQWTNKMAIKFHLVVYIRI